MSGLNYETSQDIIVFKENITAKVSIKNLSRKWKTVIKIKIFLSNNNYQPAYF